MFGNEAQWIHAALRRALTLARDWDLDVRIVSYAAAAPATEALVAELA